MARLFTVLAVLLAFAFVAGDVNAQGKGKGKKGKRKINPEKIFKALDKDGNGTLTKKEFETGMKAQNEKIMKRISKRFGEEKAKKFLDGRLKRALATWKEIDANNSGLSFEQFEKNYRKLMFGGKKGGKKRKKNSDA